MIRSRWCFSIPVALVVLALSAAHGDELARKDAAHDHGGHGAHAGHNHGKPAAKPVDAPLIRSVASGPWSEKTTWDLDRVPQKGDRVLIRPGHVVTYDVESRDVIRLVQIAGTLEFARDRNTSLEVGLITVVASEEVTEEGFDCHIDVDPPAPGSERPALLIGRPGFPIPREFRSTIRLHYVEGMDKESCPAIVCCGGEMQIHGAPLQRTWTKLKRTSEVGATSVTLAESVADWQPGDQIILTSTHMQRAQLRGRNGDSEGFLGRSQTEKRTIERVGGGRNFAGGTELTFDKPLLFSHYADDNFQGEVANLSRNVVIESANPDGVRGHTMFHKYSAGSISYAEFRHLGKADTLGRYSIHFHLCGDTMRGSSVIGASIWDSHNRWITIHGTDSLVIRDCVGFKSRGHGYFLEDATEINNILDHNLAALVLPAVTQKDQVIPFDLNRGAGFWWANCQNQFTRNVAADCAEYGYRFENKKADGFDPVQPIRQPDGSIEPRDTRTLPFIRFEDNEAHTMRFFCLNLRGIARPEDGLNFYEQNLTLAEEAADAMPEPGKPFWIRNFKAWEANWSTHLGTAGVFVDGMDSFRCDVAIWRSIMDRSGFRRMTSKEMRVNDIHNPISMGPPSASESDNRRAFGGVSSFRDELPPCTMITSAVREGNIVRVRGSVADTSDIKQVVVNGRPASSTRGSFAEWEITLEAPSAGSPMEIVAAAEDVNGHQELSPHVVSVR